MLLTTHVLLIVKRDDATTTCKGKQSVYAPKMNLKSTNERYHFCDTLLPTNEKRKLIFSKYNIISSF